ncbi:MAG TPA: YbhB/YbcL family Raf kinase inhibitor-like protein [Mycobacterium sp.]|nr:YbhB/YbcL family Raf kinase inhibitor-like protein [Mycobacterium sp.]
MRLASALAALMLIAPAGCSSGEVSHSGRLDSPEAAISTTSSAPAAPGTFTVTSPAFAENSPIPAEYSCDGRNVPPPLHWQNVPPGAESLALVVDDPDAPAGLYVHWVVTGIPPATTAIVDGALPDTAVVSLNSAGKAEYLGPCPPVGTGVHHYRFQLYALSGPLTLAPTTPVPESTTTIANLSAAVAGTVGLFGR